MSFVPGMFVRVASPLPLQHTNGSRRQCVDRKDLSDPTHDSGFSLLSHDSPTIKYAVASGWLREDECPVFDVFPPLIIPPQHHDIGFHPDSGDRPSLRSAIVMVSPFSLSPRR